MTTTPQTASANAPMLVRPHTPAYGAYPVPALIFTIGGNTKAEAIVAALNAEPDKPSDQDYMVFANEAELEAHMTTRHIAAVACVALWDGNRGNSFTFLTRTRPDDAKKFPAWTIGAQWGVAIGTRFDPKFKTNITRAVHQLRATMHRDFVERMEIGYDELEPGNFPWGKRRKKEPPVRSLRLRPDMKDLLGTLNTGPNLLRAIAHLDHAKDLPPGSRISWQRVPERPLELDSVRFATIVRAMAAFEQTCGQLLRHNPKVRKQIMAGVSLLDPRLEEAYLDPRVPNFTVTRPDLHLSGPSIMYASEVDEMPGGFPELAHIDACYGVNQSLWHQAFQWLTAKGQLVFVVSHDWSQCYITETVWLVEYMRSLGYANVHICITDNMDELQIGPDGVTFHGQPVGTVWRQFPIHETQGKLADLVMAGHNGVVRLVPEFAHFGNKAWFSLFHEHRAFFAEQLDNAVMSELLQLIPESALITSLDSLPVTIKGRTIRDWNELNTLPVDERNNLVLKVTGANPHAARCHGVFMGQDVPLASWQEALHECARDNQPFILQERRRAHPIYLPVLNTATSLPENFHCNLMVRPFVINGTIITAQGCAVPSHLMKVHGMVDMAVAPVNFEAS